MKKLPKREVTVAGLCLVTILTWMVCGYMKFQEVPGARWPFIVGVVLALVALGIWEEEWPFSVIWPATPPAPTVNHRVEVREIVLRPPPVVHSAMELEIETPTFIRLGLAAKIQGHLDGHQEEAAKRPVVEVFVAATARGGRHR